MYSQSVTDTRWKISGHRDMPKSWRRLLLRRRRRSAEERDGTRHDSRLDGVTQLALLLLTRETCCDSMVTAVMRLPRTESTVLRRSSASAAVTQTTKGMRSDSVPQPLPPTPLSACKRLSVGDLGATQRHGSQHYALSNASCCAQRPVTRGWTTGRWAA